VTNALLLRAVAAYGLSGHGGGFPTAALEEATWRQLMRSVEQQRLVGFLEAVIREGALPATEEQAAEVAEAHLRWCAGVLQLERRLLELADLFATEGFEWLILKGPAVAHLDYPAPELRSFGDLDLLFRPRDLDRVVETFAAIGYRRQTEQARPGFEQRFGKGTTLTGPDGSELDLHCNLVFGTFGLLIDLDELFRSAVRFRLGGTELSALGAETRLLHACYHAALGDPRPRFSSTRDVAQMFARGDRDEDRLLHLVRQWRAEAVVQRAILLCSDLLGFVPDGPVVRAVAQHVLSRREERAVASYVGNNRSHAAKVVATLPYLPGTRDRVAFLRAMTAPNPEFVASHGGQPGWAWVRRGVRSLLRGGSS
jgi:hypothetical protein